MRERLAQTFIAGLLTAHVTGCSGGSTTPPPPGQVPVITAVTPTGSLGLPGIPPITFAATASGSPTSWEWNFGGGIDQATSTASQPLVAPTRAGAFTGQVLARNVDGASTPFSFAYEIAAPDLPNWQNHFLANDLPRQEISLIKSVVHKDRIVFQWDSTNPSRKHVIISDPLDPVDPVDWRQYRLEFPFEDFFLDEFYSFGDTLAAVGSCQEGGFWKPLVIFALNPAPGSTSDWRACVLEPPVASQEGGLVDLAPLPSGWALGWQRPDDGFLWFATTFLQEPVEPEDWHWQPEPIDSPIGNGGTFVPLSIATTSAGIGIGYGIGDGGSHVDLQVVVSRDFDPQSSADWVSGLAIPFETMTPWGDLTTFNDRFVFAYNPGIHESLRPPLLLATALTAAPLSESDWSIQTVIHDDRTYYFPRVSVAHGRLLVTALHHSNASGLEDHVLVRALSTTPQGPLDWAAGVVNPERSVSGSGVGSIFASPTNDGRIAVSYDSAGLFFLSLSDGPW